MSNPEGPSVDEYGMCRGCRALEEACLLGCDTIYPRVTECSCVAFDADAILSEEDDA